MLQLCSGASFTPAKMGVLSMQLVSESPPKTLKSRIAEFLQSRKGLHKETLLEFADQVIEPQQKITVTAHLDENGDIDCLCLGDLCHVDFVPTEQMLGCQRLQWLFLGEDKEDDRERKEDFVEV